MSQLELLLETGDAVSVRKVVAVERANALYEVEVTCVSETATIDLQAPLGKPATVRITHGARFVRDGGTRSWAGICSHAELVKTEPTGVSTYRIVVAPRLYLLTQRTNYRVFQHRSIPEIVDAMLDEWSVPRRWLIARESYPKLEYKVQYGETDHAFVTRLLEEAGIAFVFSDDGERGASPILTLDDALPTREERAPIPYADNPNLAAEREVVTGVRLSHEVRPNACVVRDVDFRNPRFALFAEAPKVAEGSRPLEELAYAPGAFLVEQAATGETPVADDQGHARHVQAYGTQVATRRLTARRVGRRAVAFDSNVLDLRPGSIFRIGQHPHADLGETARVLVVDNRIEATVDGEWLASSRAVFASDPYAPTATARKPRVIGVEPATVVGPEGEEIHTDEFGRVRIQFPWDREGKMNERSSCWVRVSQGWAGAGYGFLAIPRVGQEVLVGFVAGDPDHPIVVGRVFNAVEDVPYRLPEHKTRSTWKSDSSKGHGGFNEIMFEDLAERELVFIQAQRDLRKLVKHDETITVGNDRRKWVLHDELETTGGNRTEVIGLDRTEITNKNRLTVVGEDALQLVHGDEMRITEGASMSVVGGDEDVVVKQDRRERIEGTSHSRVRGKLNQRVDGAYSLTVGQDQHVRVTRNLALDVSEDLHLKAGSNLVIEASQDLTIKGPGGFIRIDSEGVTIRGTRVLINSGGEAADGRGARPELPEDALEAVIAEPVPPKPENIQLTGVPRPGG